MLFKKQCDSMIYESLTVLMRVDSQMHDRDLRHKMRLCKDFVPEDFEIAEQFSMMQHLKRMNAPGQLFDDELEPAVTETAEFKRGNLANHMSAPINIAINASGNGPLKERESKSGAVNQVDHMDV